MTITDYEIARPEAAKRLVDGAIDLWLINFDPLVIHHVAMAAYGLLRDLVKLKEPEFRKHLDSLIASSFGHYAFRQITNRLKHADKDPLVNVAVPRDIFNEIVIGSALVTYQVIEEDRTENMGAFHLMMMMSHPESFNIVEDPDPDIEFGANYAAKLMREDVAMRRLMVRENLDLIRKGLLDRNINLRRKERNL